MRAHFAIIGTVSVLLAASNAAVPSSASVPGLQVGTPNKRSLRSYNMYDLDQEDTESEEERASINVSKLDDLIDAKKLDDVVDPKKISGLLNAKKLDDLVDAKKIDELIDSKKIDELMDPAKMEAALTNVDDQISLFSKWIATPGTEKAVVARLPVNTPEKLKKNMPILSKFNDFRTSYHNNQQLNDWLDTKMLDELLNRLQTNGPGALRKNFAVWNGKNVPSKQIDDAVAAVKNPLKQKQYTAIKEYYKMFIDMEKGKAKKAAAAAALAKH
ncbi:unnamed protein product [Phytophthora lilii]|uniref:RxLR effector protein n=1 Tax=Phytophthora lilii TaxID=2077276 RepID=A0A9W6XBX5_9STRA|nr:unnamed protein product [Phytophthora lilii]